MGKIINLVDPPYNAVLNNGAGGSDDGPALQQALNDLQADNRGGEIIIPGLAYCPGRTFILGPGIFLRGYSESFCGITNTGPNARTDRVVVLERNDFRRIRFGIPESAGF